MKLKHKTLTLDSSVAGCRAASGGIRPLPPSTQADFGNIRARAGERGVEYSVFSDGQWVDLGPLPATPAIEFGLVKAGWIAIAEKFTVPAAMAQTPAGQASASLPHPAASQLEANSLRTASDLIMKAFTSAVASQAEAKGCFHQPFFARCALRLADGSHVGATPPALMLPMALPPCIGIDSAAASGDSATLTFSASSHPCFRLWHRVRGSLPEAWRRLVAAVDVFVTAPVPTYDAKHASVAGLARYSTIAAKANGIDAGRAFDPAIVLAGCWSDDGQEYRDHTLADLGLHSAWAWDVQPNPSLLDDLQRPMDFYRVASIPVADLAPASAFTPLAIESTSPESIKRGLKLAAEAEPRAQVVPSVLLNSNGALHAAGQSLALPAPLAPPSFCGQADAQPVATEVEAWASRVGCQRSAANALTASPMQGHFPRYLYYPDPSASAIAVRQGAWQAVAPLRPTDDGKGAYWFAGLGVNPAPPQAQAPASCREPIPTGCIEAASLPGNPLRMLGAKPCGQGSASADAVLAPPVDVDGSPLEEGTMLTPPIELRGGVTAVTVNGRFEPGHVGISLYASDCGQKWRMLAASPAHALRGMPGTRHRCFRVKLACRLAPGESVSSVVLEGRWP